MLSQPGQRRRRRRRTSTAPSPPARATLKLAIPFLPLLTSRHLLSTDARARRHGRLRANPEQPVRHPPQAPRRNDQRVGPPWPRRGEGPAGARGGETSSSRLRPLGSCDLQDRPPSGSMDTSMRWSPSLSAAPAEARFVDPGPLLPQIALSGERWGPSSRRLPSVGKGDPVRRSLRAIRLPP